MDPIWAQLVWTKGMRCKWTLWALNFLPITWWAAKTEFSNIFNSIFISNKPNLYTNKNVVLDVNFVFGFSVQRSSGGLSIPLCAFQGTVSLQAPTGKTLSLSTYEVSSDGLKISPNNAKKVITLRAASSFIFKQFMKCIVLHLRGNAENSLAQGEMKRLISLSQPWIKHEVRLRRQFL